jgi:hypothetical protein
MTDDPTSRAPDTASNQACDRAPEPSAWNEPDEPRDARGTGAETPSLDDERIVAVQLGRAPRARSRVAHRCPLGLPTVAVVPPVLDDGVPFPTRYWLTCPLLHRRIARIEAAGRIRELQSRAERDAGYRHALERTAERYAEERDAQLSPDARWTPRGGVGGARGGIKCLHAHYADYRAGNDNPVGAELEGEVEPLNCDVPCVARSEDGGAVPNPEWREPRREAPSRGE